MKRPPGMPRWKWEQRDREQPALRHLADEKLARLKAAGVKHVQWLWSGHSDDPKRCRDAHEKIVLLSRLRRGDHGPKCRCCLIAVAGPEEDEPAKEPAPPIAARPALPGETEEQRRKRILNDFTRPLW